MGSLYRPKYRASDGMLKESAVIWLKYRDALGVLRRESSETTKEQEARRLLKQREGAAVEGRVLAPKADKITVAQLAEDLKIDYKVNGRRSADRLEFSLAHLLPALGTMLAMRMSTTDVKKYTQDRLEAGAAPATVNRELAALKRMFSLAIEDERLTRRPHIPMLKESNTRKGFFEPDQVASVMGHLPTYARGPLAFAAITGWRKSEVLGLEWGRVDFKAGVVRLDPQTAKTEHGRTFPMTPQLRALLEAERATTEAVQKRKALIVPWVFHRNGRRLKGFAKSWREACRLAGVPGRIFHDTRRSAVRTLQRAGVPTATAMELVGHRTMAIYKRYSITDDVMLREGAAKLAAYSDQAR